MQLWLGVDCHCPKYKEKERKQTEKGKARGYGGRKGCDSFASVLCWWLRRRQWARVKSRGMEAVRHEAQVKCMADEHSNISVFAPIQAWMQDDPYSGQGIP